MTFGTVKFFNTIKGFGFITPEGGAKDVFVRDGRRSGGHASLAEGQRVSFDISAGREGARRQSI
jgi:CspA family cold shock protein